MTVQRYHSWDSEDDEDGHYVAHDDYAALLKDRDALAVENAKAKSVLKQCQEYFIAGIRNEIRPTNEGYLHMICDTFADENPATDAAIANIKAQGVDIAINHLTNKFEGTGQIGVPVMALEWLATELRKGEVK